MTSWRWILPTMALMTSGACKPDAPPPPAASARVKTYAMRGLVKGKPPASPTGQDLSIEHEPVSDFMDEFGKVVGMDTMVMPFRLAPSVDASAVQPGDKIAFTLQVDWDKPQILLTSLQKLPPETALVFGHVAH